MDSNVDASGHLSLDGGYVYGLPYTARVGAGNHTLRADGSFYAWSPPSSDPEPRGWVYWSTRYYGYRAPSRLYDRGVRNGYRIFAANYGHGQYYVTDFYYACDEPRFPLYGNLYM